MTRLHRRDLLRAAGGLATIPFVDGALADSSRTSPRPGPDLLYGDPPTPPQLENGPAWSADPLLVSGTDAYVDGEYLYQDFVYDDHGPDTATGPVPPSPEPDDEAAHFSAPTGDAVYPTADRYRENAADLLEFRARPRGNRVVYRFTLQTMVEPDAAVLAVGLDTGGGDRTDWGHGLGDLGAPVDHVLVTWGTGATLDGQPLPDDAVSVDVERNQIEVEAPLQPGDATWRHYCVTGVHDGEGGFVPLGEQPSESQPGGAHGRDVPPVFNVAFRFDEPFGATNLRADRAEREVEETREQEGSRAAGYGSWREHAQAKALANRDVARFGADLDFGKLRRRETDRRTPDSGYLSLLYPSRLDLGEGVVASADVFRNRIQPYSAYVPESYDETPTPALLFMHSLSACYNQYATFTPNLLRQLGERNDAIVFTPEARGPSGWYQREAEVATFEAFRDLRGRFSVDMDRVSLGGYSMGGYGTYKFASQYPDLFARGFAVVGPADEDVLGGPTNDRVDGASSYSEDPENTMRVTDNLRHVPLLMWAGANDELVPLPGVVNYEQQLRDHGYRHELAVFPGYDHFTFALRDQWGPGREFLDGATVTRAPARVTYRRVPDFDHPDLDLIHDGAYWVSDIAVRSDADSGLVDAISRAAGYAEPVTEDFRAPGTEPAPHAKRGTRWKTPLTEPAGENALEATLDGVSAATLWLTETGLTLSDLTIRVESDGPATLTLVGSSGERDVTVEAGETERRLS